MLIHNSMMESLVSIAHLPNYVRLMKPRLRVCSRAEVGNFKLLLMSAAPRIRVFSFDSVCFCQLDFVFFFCFSTVAKTQTRTQVQPYSALSVYLVDAVYFVINFNSPNIRFFFLFSNFFLSKLFVVSLFLIHHYFLVFFFI